MTQITHKFSVILFLSSIVGIALSFLLLKEDVLSTANTLYVYFPSQFGVTPAITEDGGLFLGIFVSVAQIITLAIALSASYKVPIRVIAGLFFALAMPFDGWTDVVFRSGYLKGDLIVATITTIAFYTFGSELLQSLSWVLFLSVWRQAIADIMWSLAYGANSVSTVGREWTNFVIAARNVARKEADSRISRHNNRYVPTSPSRSYEQSLKTTDQKPKTSEPIRSESWPRPAPRPVSPSMFVPPKPKSASATSSRDPKYRSEPTYHPMSMSSLSSEEIEQSEMFDDV